MGIYIKGAKMPMPERCWDCRFMDLQIGKCYADGSVRGTAKGYKRPVDCPIFHVPEFHGDLVDIDRMLDDFAELRDYDFASREYVVIPAERSKDEYYSR